MLFKIISMQISTFDLRISRQKRPRVLQSVIRMRYLTCAVCEGSHAGSLADQLGDYGGRVVRIQLRGSAAAVLPQSRLQTAPH